MLNSASFTQMAPNASRAPSQTSKTRHRRTHSHGRRPKAERVISMSRNVSRKSDAIDARINVSPNWTKNEKYCVTRLPGRPPQIDNLGQFPRVSGTTSGDSSYALVSTPESVYAWSYTTQHSDPVVLTFPVRSREPALASLVSPNAGSYEPGLILLKPLTGQIAYWDAVGSAVAEGLIQRAGVQTTLPLAPGDQITHLCNAEPAGFVVATSKGSLWIISVRDLEGRPALSCVAMTSTGGAWLSGLRSFIGGGFGRVDVVAVKSGVRGDNTERRELFVATMRGGIEKWELARGGVYRLCGHGDVYVALQESLRQQLSMDPTISVVDIAAVPSVSGSSNKLVILVSYTSQDSSGHAIFLCLYPEAQPPQIVSGTVLPPSPSDHSSLRPASQSQPQIYVPAPGRSAFIVYSRGFSVISIPDSTDDWPYCDTVRFRDDFSQLRIIGSGQEDCLTDRTSHRKLRSPGVVLVIQGAGVVRVETFDMELGDLRMLTSGQDWIQSKIEQAVFYGTSAENPLDFKPRPEWNWKLRDVEHAVSKISTEVQSSVSKYTQVGLGLEEFLSSKCQSLLALAQYIESFFPSASYATRQTLLLDAEKAEAARLLWQTWGKRLEVFDSHERVTQVLESVVKDLRREATGEAVYIDVVREWFKNEPAKFGDLIVRSLHFCQKYVRSQYGKDPVYLARVVLETNEIYSLTAAHEYRAKYQDVYSTTSPPNNLKLSSTLAPWTSSPDIIAVLVPQYDTTLSILRDFHANPPMEAESQTRKTRQQTEHMEREDMRLALEETLASLAEVLCKICVERVNWCRALAEDEQDKSGAEEIWQQYLAKRGDWIKPLATFGRSDKALDIAEIYRDYKSLVELCLEPRDEDISRQARVHERLEYYLSHFGEEFAFTLYSHYLQNQMYGELLQEFPREKSSLSKFLQPPKYDKLRWVHELSLSRFQDAGHTLREIASRERRLRTKKLSLSIGKLSLLVVPNEAPQVATISVDLEAITAQERFAEEIVKPIVENCIDNQARVDVALEQLYSSRNLKKTHMRTRVVKRAMELLVEDRVIDPESLVDLFTLKKRGHGPSAETEFETYFWALQVLRAAELPKPRKDLALKLIWLRAYLQDDWPKIERSVLNMLEDEIEQAWRATAVYQVIHYAMNSQVMGSTVSPFHPLQPSETLLPDKQTLLAIITPRLARWGEGDIDRYVNELLAESEMLKKWAGKLEGDESRLLGSLQSLAKKDLDALRGADRVKEITTVAHGTNGTDQGDKTGNEDVEMIY